MSSLHDEVEQLVVPVLSANKIELVDLTYQKSSGDWILTLVLDKEGGISLGDCELWSQKIGEILDQSDVLSGQYKLEVSSPGIYRVLKKLKDFHRFSGERVSVKLFKPINGQKKFSGILMDPKDDVIGVRLDNNGAIELPINLIAKANLDPIIKF